MPWELVDRMGHVHRLYDGVKVGRAPDTGITISDARASRVHAEFRVRGDSIMARDLNSTNGTYINQVRLTSPSALNSGDLITIGDSTFLLRWVAEGVAAAPRPPYPETQSAASANAARQQISVEPDRRLPDQAAALGQFMYCPVCGRQVALSATSCPGCGANLARRDDSISERDWLTTLLLCILTGVLGVHRFYTGHIGTGILQLLTGGGFGIWWLIDLIYVVTGKFRDSEGRIIAKK